MEGVLTIAEVVTEKPDYVKVKDAGGKNWNCNEKRLLRLASDGKPVFSVGRRLKVEYNESQPEGQRFPSRWINDAMPASDEDKDTFAPRERKSYGAYPGNHRKKDNGEFRNPEQIMRSTAIGTAVSYAQGRDLTPSEVIAIAKDFYAYIYGEFEAKVEAVAEELDATPVGDDDIPF